MEARGDGADDGEEEGGAGADGGGGVLGGVEEGEVDIGVVEEAAPPNKGSACMLGSEERKERTS